MMRHTVHCLGKGGHISSQTGSDKQGKGKIPTLGQKSRWETLHLCKANPGTGMPVPR